MPEQERMSYSDYHSRICFWMKEIASVENTIFLGQQVASEDFYGTLKDVDMSKRLEMPVAEDMQTGLAIGLSLQGFLPISIYQRMDFLPRTADQIINHLDLLSHLSRNRFEPQVVIRTTVGTTNPLDVGVQHSKDLTKMFKGVVGFEIFNVRTIRDIDEAYSYAIHTKKPSMIVEYQELYVGC